MESQRNLLLLALLFVSYLLYQAWIVEQTPVVSTQATEQSTLSVPKSSNYSADVPTSSTPAVVVNDIVAPIVTAETVLLENDKLRLSISLRGGDVVVAELLEHDTEKDSNIPFRILTSDSDFTYIAQSGLIGQGPDASKQGRPIYTVTTANAAISDGQDSVSIALRFVDNSGNVFVKTFTLARDKYVVNVNYHIENNSDNALNVQFYGQLKETIGENDSNLMMPVYRGGAFSTSDGRYQKYTFDDMKEGRLSAQTKGEGGWVAMLQHYFLSAWLPASHQDHELFSNVIDNKLATIGFKAPMKTIDAHSTADIGADLWVGPKLQSEMAEAAEHLDLTVDYGWLWFIAQPLFQLLLLFQSFVVNWGVAIILITFTVKGALYPLTKAQYTSMAKMRLLQPKIQALRDRFGSDRQKVSKAMMELYKEEKVNPLGGCFPILLQMPIFIALYWSLMESVELRHAPFMLWIDDLSVQDPFYVLPILMGVSMFFIQKMSPTQVQDPVQQKIMKFMPIVFTFFFLWFPAGLVLYWLMSNIVTLLQQTYIYKQFDKQQSAKSK